MKKKSRSFFGKSWVLPLTLVSAMGLLSGAARADINAAQSQAMAENGAAQTAQFLLGVLGACANIYPETQADVVKAMQSMSTKGLEEKEATRIIGKVGQCMSKDGAPTKSQCSELATQVPSTSFDPNDKQFTPVIMGGLQMLEPCRRAK